MASGNVKETASITDLISSYAILPSLASWISAVDLYHLALTNRTHNAHILGSKNIFNTLCRQSLCDGLGLVERQKYPDIDPDRHYVWGSGRKIHQDEEMEVRLFNIKCDEAGALPCVRCGINICEECRYCPRIPPHHGYPVRRPHLNSPRQLCRIMVQCPECDAATEESLKGKFLNPLCDCDVFTRWICVRCEKYERQLDCDYWKKCAASYDSPEDNHMNTKLMADHQAQVLLWCPCGKAAPQATRVRCMNCNRRHLDETEWHREWDEIGSQMPLFDNDPYYPKWVQDTMGRYPYPPYPELEYDRILRGEPTR